MHPKLELCRLPISPIALERPTLLSAELPWWLSLLEFQVGGLGEAVGRNARSAPRAQQLAGLLGGGTNCLRCGDAKWFFDASSLRCCLLRFV